MTRNVVFAIALLALARCDAKPAVSRASVVRGDSSVSAREPWNIRTRPAGKDCDVLFVETGLVLDAAMVEAMHYGTGPFRSRGKGMYSRAQGFRGVVYKDTTGKIWTYGSVTEAEARSLPRCEDPPATSTRRALLIGIDDYTASRLGARAYVEGERDLPNLRGAVNDARLLKQMLVDTHAFDARNVITLTDQNATRGAIVGALNDLVRRSAAGDVVFFYFAGHGSQVANSRSAEADRLDESIVPADSRAGAPDIRDKELRAVFNRILDRDARLTVMLDNCHSASGARGSPARGVAADLRDVADPGTGGPAPESRGALVIASVQDDEIAWELQGDDGNMHGAFSWAWIRAMRDARRDEAAVETFLRAQARLRGEKPFQTPAISGNTDARLTPFLGERRGRERSVVAVEKVRADGTVVLQGGLAHGLTPGSELHAGDGSLAITATNGIARSEASAEGTVRAGELLETTRQTRHWHELEPESPSPFRLALRRARDGAITSTGPLRGGERYSVVLRAAVRDIPRRFVYVFVIDSAGKSFLLYPRNGSVENRHASAGDLGDASAFTVAPPYGIDTYFLLTTDEALPNPWMLGWDDVRTATLVTAGSWSLDKLTLESVP